MLLKNTNKICFNYNRFFNILIAQEWKAQSEMAKPVCLIYAFLAQLVEQLFSQSVASSNLAESNTATVQRLKQLNDKSIIEHSETYIKH